MKYIKTYEDINTINYSDLDKVINDRIHVQDYVVVLDDQLNPKNYELGKITEIINPYVATYTVFLFDRNITKWFFNTEIVYHSKNKEDCETFIDTKKYNL